MVDILTIEVDIFELPIERVEQFEPSDTLLLLEPIVKFVIELLVEPFIKPAANVVPTTNAVPTVNPPVTPERVFIFKLGILTVPPITKVPVAVVALI